MAQMKLVEMARARPRIAIAYAAFLVIIVAVVIGPEIWGNGKSKDYPLWLITGRRFLEGLPLYPQDGGQFPFLYSPFAAMIFAPVAALGAIPLYLTLIAVSALSWFWVVRLSTDAFRPPGAETPAALLVWPSIICLPLLFNNFDIGQPNLALLAVVMLALMRDKVGRSLSAGALIGAAAAFKLFPLALTPYWLVRRRWRALGMMVASFAVLLVAAPSLARGPDRTFADLALWLPGISATNETSLAQRDHNWGYKNQSLLAMTHRLTRSVDAKISEEKTTINIVDLGFDGANKVYLVLAAMLGMAFLAFMLRATPADEPRVWVVLLCLITIASALARNYYFVWLLPALTALVADAISPDAPLARRARWFLVAAVSFMALSFGGVPKIFQAYGNMLIATLIICVGVSLPVLERSTGFRLLRSTPN